MPILENAPLYSVDFFPGNFEDYRSIFVISFIETGSHMAAFFLFCAIPPISGGQDQRVNMGRGKGPVKR